MRYTAIVPQGGEKIKALEGSCRLFVNIQKPDALFRKIGECEGSVSYLDGQGAHRDLKRVAAQMLDLGAPLRLQAIPSLEVLADSPRDRQKLMSFMMESRC